LQIEVYVLMVILQPYYKSLDRKNVKVVRVKGQVELKSPYPGGRNIKLDIDAVDGKYEWTLDQALTASGIQGKEHAIIAKQLQK